RSPENGERFYSSISIDVAVMARCRIRLNPPMQSPGHSHGQLKYAAETIRRPSMAKATNPIPKGYHTITPSLTCRDAAKAIDFYKKAFGAQELMRMPSPDGKISHAEIKIGDSVVFISDEFPGRTAAPSPTATPSSSLFLYVEDVDTVFNRAV